MYTESLKEEEVVTPRYFYQKKTKQMRGNMMYTHFPIFAKIVLELPLQKAK